MKRPTTALILLVVILAASWWNIRHINTLTAQLTGQVETVRGHWAAGRTQEAEAAMDELLRQWEAAESYTHVFIRHSEVDAASDTLFELREALEEDEGTAVNAAADKARYHLESIRDMEQLTLRSIF